jgi:hypothetical protein
MGVFAVVRGVEDGKLLRYGAHSGVALRAGLLRAPLPLGLLKADRCAPFTSLTRDGFHVQKAVACLAC